MDSKFTITLNGKEVEAIPGQTILDVARSHGVHIPALCNHKALIPRGSCRLCVVEEGGRVRASCTTPAERGMKIVTDSPRLRAAREVVLQLIFTGRNHYCMYCEVSGNCELQDLGYEFGMDHFTFPTYENRFPVDNSHEFILLDHNRCVLCGRCIRACADLAGHNVLTEKSRGYRTLIAADLDIPLGFSSCVSCGSCVQVCPTGAFIEKRSAYQGKKEQIKTVRMACDMCPVGCAVDVHGNPETNSVVKIHGDWDAPPTFGLMCRTGRYLSLFDGHTRLTNAKFRQDSKVLDIALEGALNLFAARMDQGTAYVDGSLYNEELARLKELFPGRLFSLHPVSPPLPSTARIKDLGEADLFVLFRLDLDREYGALGSLVKKRVRSGAARLVLVDGSPEVFEKLPAERLSSKAFLARLDMLEGAAAAVALYRDLGDKEKEALEKRESLRRIWLPGETNTVGLARYGIEHAPVKGDTVFLFGGNLRESDVGNPAFLVCFTPYENGVTKKAAVVVPTLKGFEKNGTLFNLEGELLTRAAVVTPPAPLADIAKLLSPTPEKR